MNKKCIICKNRKSCFLFNFGGGLRDGEYCKEFREERDITEEEQERQQQESKVGKSIFKRLLGK